MLTIGDIRVHVLTDGSFALDGGAMFGVVPRVVWEKTDPADDKNRVTLGLNVALVEAAGKRILVDSGLGDKWSERERGIFRIDRSANLIASLAGLGVSPEQIDVVINTHLHFDHAGGNTRAAEGRVVPTFPNARYLVQLGEWEDATHPHERSRASYREEDYVPIAEARQLETVQGEVEVVPGVRVVPVGGHTAYHQMVMVGSNGQTLAIPTDLVPTASHLPLPFIMGYDLFPLGTLEAKRRVLARAFQEKWKLLFYHDPRIAVASIQKHKEKYVLAEAIA